MVDCGVALNIISCNIVIDGACDLGLKNMAYQIVREIRKNGSALNFVTWRLLDKLHGNSEEKHNGSIQKMGSEEAVVGSRMTSEVAKEVAPFRKEEKNNYKKEMDDVPYGDLYTIHHKEEDGSGGVYCNSHSDNSAGGKRSCLQLN